ncbi:MAG: hypothetical protein QF535_03910, partial [Anaerolineales bacterium]|nr:hypothetical protein [Anaerolineales bacterium]
MFKIENDGEIEIQLQNPLTDGQGIGTHEVSLSQATTYKLLAANPDNQVVESELAVSFNDPTINLQPVVSAEGEAELYHGRPVTVTWNDVQNLQNLQLYLVLDSDPITPIEGAEFLQLNNAAEIANTTSWTFTLPESEQGNISYNILAQFADPNNQDLISVNGVAFNVGPRPLPVVSSFTLTPNPIVNLRESPNGIVGDATLSWTTLETDPTQPIISIEQSVNGGQFVDIPADVSALSGNDSLALTLLAEDGNATYQMTIQNRFGDQASTADNGNAPNVTLEFADPSIVNFNAQIDNAADVFPESSVLFDWQTNTATELDLVLVRAGQADEVI